MPSAKLYWCLLRCVLPFSLSLAVIQAGSLPDMAGVPNFHQVNEHVYRGAQPHGAGFASLAKLGIKTIVDLRGEKSEQADVERAGIHYVRLHWSGYKAPGDEQMAAVLSLLNDNSAWPVFVHCRRGADRTGTAIACYRISHDHWTNQQALDEAKSFGMNPMEVAMQHFILRFSAPAAVSAASSSPAFSPVAVPVVNPAP
jgi:tyrosine-protein phosphatase SIW14